MKKFLCMLLILVMVPMIALAETMHIVVYDQEAGRSGQTFQFREFYEEWTPGDTTTISAVMPEGYVVKKAIVNDSEAYNGATSVSLNHDNYSGSELTVTFSYKAAPAPEPQPEPDPEPEPQPEPDPEPDPEPEPQPEPDPEPDPEPEEETVTNEDTPVQVQNDSNEEEIIPEQETEQIPVILTAQVPEENNNIVPDTPNEDPVEEVVTNDEVVLDENLPIYNIEPEPLHEPETEPDPVPETPTVVMQTDLEKETQEWIEEFDRQLREAGLYNEPTVEYAPAPVVVQEDVTDPIVHEERKTVDEAPAEVVQQPASAQVPKADPPASKTYKVEVKYVDENDKTLINTRKFTINENEWIMVLAPQIAGYNLSYRPDECLICGTQNIKLTFVYSSNKYARDVSTDMERQLMQAIEQGGKQVEEFDWVIFNPMNI